MSNEIKLECKCGNKTFYHTWRLGNIWDKDGNVVREVRIDSDEHFWCEKCNKQVFLNNG